MLLYAIGTDEKFDRERVIFQVITGNAEIENIFGVLPFPSLICENLKLQKNVLEEDEALEALRKPIRISSKLYTGPHFLYVEGNQENEMLDSPFVSKDVTTDLRASNFTLFHYLSFELVHVKKRRKEVEKLYKQLKIESVQLAAKESCIRTLIAQETDDMPLGPTSSDDDNAIF